MESPNDSFDVNKEIVSLLNAILHQVDEADIEEFAKQLISVGCDVNMKNFEGDPLLATAIKQNYIKVVKFLLHAGANIENNYFLYGRGPLLLAAKHGLLGMVELFIEYGFDVCPNKVPTPLHMAAFCGNNSTPNKDDYPHIVRLLIKNGAKVNVGNRAYDSPLHCTCKCDINDTRKYVNYEVMQILIDAGADIHSVYESGLTPLDYAIISDFKEGAKLLRSKGASFLTTKFSRSLLFYWASNRKNCKILRMSLELGADVFIDGGKICFNLAVKCGDIEIVQYMLNNCSVPKNVFVDSHHTLTDTLSKWPSTCETFDSENSDYDNDIERYNTKFKDQLKCLRLLIESGANVNQKNKDGLTSLYIVLDSFKSHSDVVRVLLKSGAELDFDHKVVRKVMTYPNGSKFPKLLIRHAALSEQVNLTNMPNNFDVNKLNEEQQMYYRDCKNELEAMKLTKIGNTNVSFFHILDDRDIGPYARNNDVESCMSETHVSKYCPIYHDLVIERFSKEVENQKLAWEATKGLSYALSWNENSLMVVLDGILKYLNDEEKNVLATL